MPVKTQGTTLKVETALAAAKTITVVTLASPCVVTAVGHGYANGDIIKITGIVGTEELNDRAFVAAAITTDTFTLKGVDSTSYSAYVSGGSAQKATMTEVGKVDAIPTIFAGQANTINTTHLKSRRTENIQGLASSGTCSLSGIVEDDDGQDAMDDANELQAEKVYTIIRPDAKVACMVAFCDQFQTAAAANDIYRYTAALTLKAARTKFA